MVDAGSAGTRAHIFTWAKKDVSIKMRPTSKNHSECIYKSNIPLSAAKDNISVINSIFDPMVRFLIDHIPQTEMPKTKVYVFATAGLRMLDFSQQAAILEKTYKRLKKSPFNIQRKNIRIMSGTEEAVYGWISVNYLLDLLESRDTKGALDMGGASTQISYEVNSMKPDTEDGDIHIVRYKKKSHKVFSLSFLGYGVNEAFKKTLNISGKQTPCFPLEYENENGYVGTGNFQNCVKDAEKITNPTQNEISLDSEFYSMASFVYVNNFFKLPFDSSLSLLEKSGSNYCASSWNNIIQNYTGDHLNYLKNYCFFAAFQKVFFSGNFGFRFDNTVYKNPSLDDTELSWAIGALLTESKLVGLDSINWNNVFMFVISLVVIFSFLLVVNYFRNIRYRRRIPLNKYL